MLAAAAIFSASSASASGRTAASPDFYTPPAPLPPSENGDVIRNEPADFFLDPAKLTRAPADVQRIMYRSTDANDRPVAVTGTVLTPHVPWKGEGPRPVIGFATGTQGLGDQCAPSRQMAAGSEYEGMFISGLLLRGYGVVVTDYEGLGTPGLHTYAVRAAQGHAVLDAVRAAQRLPEADLADDGPVAVGGYSQGGGASAAAAEMQPEYAPELDLRGAYSGAPPAELGAVGEFLDGSHAVAFLGYAAVAMNEAYPELGVPDLLNDEGKRKLAEFSEECTVESIAKHAFTRTETLTKDGRPITAYLSEEPFASKIAEQRIGLTPPGAPVFVSHTTLDDIVPFEQGRQMARDWCDRGATVQFDTLVIPTHVGAAPEAAARAFGWLEGRFAGDPAPDNCGSF
ncbi:lipase family protein [Saccharopolyspora taberi]|uniref:Lipase family protein n=1 Tax=Saccharopolyspora taberi TaxID=60895 RepID=A0ABN3VJ03_9PSEU